MQKMAQNAAPPAATHSPAIAQPNAATPYATASTRTWTAGGMVSCGAEQHALLPRPCFLVLLFFRAFHIRGPEESAPWRPRPLQPAENVRDRASGAWSMSWAASGSVSSSGCSRQDVSSRRAVSAAFGGI